MALRTGAFGSYHGSTQGGSVALTWDEMTVNAVYIRAYLRDKGWWDGAIYAIIGNMQAESTMNPGRWQNDSPGIMASGYGLVQWTPATKYIEWVAEQFASGQLSDSDYSTMDNNLARIIYEVENKIQWIPADNYIWSFSEWTRSSAPIEELARAFMLCYERPANQSEEAQQVRATMALYWYNAIKDLPDVPVIPDNPDPDPSAKKKKRKYNFIIMNAKRRRDQEWIRRNF